MIAWVITYHHIEHHAGNIALYSIPGLPAVTVIITLCGFHMGFSSIVKVQIAPTGIHTFICGSQVVNVRIRSIDFIGKTVGFRPDMLPVPAIASSSGALTTVFSFALGSSCINEDHIIRVIRIFISFLQDIPYICRC